MVLEKTNALLAKTNIQLETPLHSEPGTVASAATGGKVTLVDHHDTSPGIASAHPPGRGQSVGTRADNQYVGIGRHPLG